MLDMVSNMINNKILSWILVTLLSVGQIPIIPSESTALKNSYLNVKTYTYPAAYFKFKDFKKSLSDYPFFKEYCFDPYKHEKDDGTIVIPGLKVTGSINSEKQPAFCGNMIPQGLCATEDYLIVSAYCHDLEHNSVLYLINKHTGDYVKTIVLPNRPHSGSVAYDPNSRSVWISTGSTGKASVSMIYLSNMLNYNFSENYEPIAYDAVHGIPSITRNSFMTYYDSHLYAGTFTNASKSSSLQPIYLEDEGVLLNNVPNTDGLKKSTIGPKVQGYSRNARYIFMSFSNGPYETSTLAVFKPNAPNLFLVNAIKTFTLPECLEQIWLDGNRLYIMFESAGWPFRNDTIHHIDRIISVDITKLGL